MQAWWAEDTSFKNIKNSKVSKRLTGTVSDLKLNMKKSVKCTDLYSSFWFGTVTNSALCVHWESEFLK